MLACRWASSNNLQYVSGFGSYCFHRWVDRADLWQLVRLNLKLGEQLVSFFVGQYFLFWNELVLEDVESWKSLGLELYFLLLSALFDGVSVSSIGDHYSSLDISVFHGFAESVYAVYANGSLSRDAPHQDFLFLFWNLDYVADGVFVFLLLYELVSSELDQNFGFTFFETHKLFAQI